MKYRAGEYLRLSDADKDKQVSDSIENQNLIIKSYVERQEDVEIYKKYIDDGRTGMNYNRDGFQDMMEDVENGNINMIIVKDLSRIGREHCDTITLLKRVLPEKQIRFVAVVDNIDMNGPQKAQSTLDVPFKVMVNDYYSQNISTQVRNAQKIKREAGKFIGSYACYGYIKDPEDKNHLLIDAEAARVVNNIYNEFIAGNNIQAIARSLNAEQVYCPTEYKNKIQGLNYRNCNKLNKTNYWTYSTVRSILTREMYIGNMVQHTVEKLAYNINKVMVLDEDEYDRVENMHEAIVSKEQFDMVQKLLKHRYRQMNCSNRSMYAGFIVCGDCGRAMSKSKTKIGFAYRCGTYARYGKQYCSAHYITEMQLNQLVLKAIQQNTAEALKKIDSADFKKEYAHTEKSRGEKKLSALENKIVQMKQEKIQMLTNLSKKVLSESDYILYNENYEKEFYKISREIEFEKEKKIQDNEYSTIYNNWIDNFIQYANITEINRDVIINLIEKINFYENNIIEISFRFKNPFE